MQKCTGVKNAYNEKFGYCSREYKGEMLIKCMEKSDKRQKNMFIYSSG